MSEEAEELNANQLAQCEAWEQMIIDGSRVSQLPNFNPELMISYWRSQGFRRESLEPLRAQFNDFYAHTDIRIREC